MPEQGPVSRQYSKIIGHKMRTFRHNNTTILLREVNRETIIEKPQKALIVNHPAFRRRMLLHLAK